MMDNRFLVRMPLMRLYTYVSPRDRRKENGANEAHAYRPTNNSWSHFWVMDFPNAILCVVAAHQWMNDCVTLTDICFSLQSPLRRMRAGNLYLNCFLYRLVFPPAFITVTYCSFIKFLTAVEPCWKLCSGMSCLGFAFYFRFTCAWRWWLFRWNIYASLTHVRR